MIGARMMLRVNERTLRVVVIVIGVILTLGMFALAPTGRARTRPDDDRSNKWCRNKCVSRTLVSKIVSFNS